MGSFSTKVLNLWQVVGNVLFVILFLKVSHKSHSATFISKYNVQSKNILFFFETLIGKINLSCDLNTIRALILI